MPSFLPLLWIITGCAFGFIAVRALSTRSRPRALTDRLTWARQARVMGLKPGKTRRMRGKIDGHPVQIQMADADTLELQVAGVPHTLSLSSERWARSAGLVGEDLLTGHAHYDKDIEIHGDPVLATAVLNHEVRRLSHKLLAAGTLRMEDGVLVARTRRRVDDPRVARLLRRMLALARALQAEGRSPPERMLHSFQHDPEPSVQLKNLRVLLQLGGQSADRAAQLGLQRRNARLRITCAAHLQAQGPILEIAGDASQRGSVRCAAVDALIRLRSRGPRAISLIEALLQDADRSVRFAAVRAVGKLRINDLFLQVYGVVERLEREPARPTRRRVRRLRVGLRALARLGDSRAQDLALRVLSVTDVPQLRLDALEALQRFGTPTAVPTLKPWAAKLFRSAQVRARAQAAIDAIQSRACGKPGALSLAAPTPRAGQLDLAQRLKHSEDPRPT